MSAPLQITVRGMVPPALVEPKIRARFERLDRFHRRITHCHVVVDAPHQLRHTGRHFSVRLDIRTPDGEIVVTRDPTDDHDYQDFGIVVRDAFDVAARKLEVAARRREAAP